MIEFRMPSMGADMDEGMLVGWLVEPGDEVHRGQVIAEIESEKGIIEAECWDEGIVDELLVEPGPTPLEVGTPLARLRPLSVGAEEPQPVMTGATASAEAGAPQPVMTGATTSPTVDAEPPPAVSAPVHVTPPVRHLARELGVDLGSITGPVTRTAITRAASRRGGGRPHASPRARIRAEQMGVDLETLTPARPDGLITFDDVARTTPQTIGAEKTSGGKGSPTVGSESAPEDRRAAMRRAVARAMTHSKREIPHYYLATHIDLSSCMAWLEERNEDRSIADRVLPAVLLLKATAMALREVPDLNGHFVDDGFRASDRIHLGVAVSLREGGLVAPAIHDADLLDIDELMAALRDLVTRARTWRIRSSEMSDPTITVTNLGDRGVETAFPVIIPPQVAIVGFGKVTDQPVALGGMLGVHPVVHATLAADHRVTDGHRGGLFLEALARLLQHPEDL
jgi:pyruvate dehydrogenase E2 component (dihydrolipoamide acetyltransferase)